MRHRKKIHKLGRSRSHRKALIRNLATSLAIHGQISTTVAKAKALASFYEKMITRVKNTEDMNAIRDAKKYLYTKEAQMSFMEQVASTEKKSGFVTILKQGFRPGDRAHTALVKFIA